MIGAVSALAILLIAYWYYKTADEQNLPILPWVAGGVIVYYAGFLGWMHLVLRPLLGGNLESMVSGWESPWTSPQCWQALHFPRCSEPKSCAKSVQVSSQRRLKPLHYAHRQDNYLDCQAQENIQVPESPHLLIAKCPQNAAIADHPA